MKKFLVILALTLINTHYATIHANGSVLAKENEIHIYRQANGSVADLLLATNVTTSFVGGTILTLIGSAVTLAPLLKPKSRILWAGGLGIGSLLTMTGLYFLKKPIGKAREFRLWKSRHNTPILILNKNGMKIEMLDQQSKPTYRFYPWNSFKKVEIAYHQNPNGNKYWPDYTRLLIYEVADTRGLLINLNTLKITNEIRDAIKDLEETLLKEKILGNNFLHHLYGYPSRLYPIQSTEVLYQWPEEKKPVLAVKT